MNRKVKLNKPVLLALAIILVLAIGLGSYFYNRYLTIPKDHMTHISYVTDQNGFVIGEQRIVGETQIFVPYN